MLRRFLTEAPGVEIELTEAVTDLEIVDQVERGELESPSPSSRCAPGRSRQSLLLDPFLFVVPAGRTVQEPRPATTENRLRVPVVCFRSCPSTRIVLTYLRERGIEPDVVLGSDQNETLLGAVEAGLGAAVVPRLAHDLTNGGTDWFALGPDAPARQVSLVWHAERSLPAAAQTFVAVARGGEHRDRRPPCVVGKARSSSALHRLNVPNRSISAQGLTGRHARSSLTTCATEFAVADFDRKGG